jgi:hypothetical protein
MRYLKKHIMLFALLLIMFSSNAQFDPSKVSRVENGKIIFRLDNSWTDAQKSEVEELFNLDSTVWRKIHTTASEVIVDSVLWKVNRISQSEVELSKNLENKPVLHFEINDVFLTDENWPVAPGYVDQDKVIFGSNNFKNKLCFTYSNGQARFYLPGYLKTRRAYIAGSFNNWNPARTSMLKVDTGWVVNIPLAAGKYYYKFILDGNWMPDPNNRLSEDDGQGNTNSALFCPNFIFKLNGFTSAREVYVAGNFNNWNKNELKMQSAPGGWSLPVYLKDGTYSYKFLVDGNWISDPSNKITREDENKNLNSVVGLGEEYTFRLSGFESAGRVVLTGNFNNWNPNELIMIKTAGGWQLPYKLAPGNYEYKFIVDGKWIPDPSNPYTIGKGNFTNSCLAFKTNYTFTLDKFPDVRKVIVTGTFNNWNTDGYRMVKKDGIWTCPVYLKPGKTLYKYIVDGKWMLDPNNKLWEQNEYGNGNSVLWIK